MTDKEIDAMQAGREMDALIAEKLFGAKWFVSETTGKRILLPPDKQSSRGGPATGAEPLAKQWDANIRECYSTEIEDAWRVVERMRELGFHRVQLELETGKWRCDFKPWIGNKSSADTAPLAICRAALKAVAHLPRNYHSRCVPVVAKCGLNEAAKTTTTEQNNGE